LISERLTSYSQKIMAAYALVNNDDSTWIIVLLLALVGLVLAKLTSDHSKKAKSEKDGKLK